MSATNNSQTIINNGNNQTVNHSLFNISINKLEIKIEIFAFKIDSDTWTDTFTKLYTFTNKYLNNPALIGLGGEVLIQAYKKYLVLQSLLL